MLESKIWRYKCHGHHNAVGERQHCQLVTPTSRTAQAKVERRDKQRHDEKPEGSLRLRVAVAQLQA